MTGPNKRPQSWALATVAALAAVCALAGGAGCAPVPAWARSAVLTPAMAPPGGTPGRALRDHVREIREPAARASSGGGATCGCN